MPNDLTVHMVEYLSATTCQIGGDDPDEQEEIVCITIRPDEGSFRSHNVGLKNSAAQRLLSDLKRLLNAAPLILLLFTGCSARVEVTQERSAPATKAVVAVDVLAESDEQKEKPVDVIVAGDLHLHRHIHFHEKPTLEPVQVERRRIGNDARCEQLRKEHKARVRKWWAEMGR